MNSGDLVLGNILELLFLSAAQPTVGHCGPRSTMTAGAGRVTLRVGL